MSPGLVFTTDYRHKSRVGAVHELPFPLAALPQVFLYLFVPGASSSDFIFSRAEMSPGLVFTTDYRHKLRVGAVHEPPFPLLLLPPAFFQGW